MLSDPLILCTFYGWGFCFTGIVYAGIGDKFCGLWYMRDVWSTAAGLCCVVVVLLMRFIVYARLIGLLFASRRISWDDWSVCFTFGDRSGTIV